MNQVFHRVILSFELLSLPNPNLVGKAVVDGQEGFFFGLLVSSLGKTNGKAPESRGRWRYRWWSGRRRRLGIVECLLLIADVSHYAATGQQIGDACRERELPLMLVEWWALRPRAYGAAV
jgi:hypothetical protein